MTHLGYLIAGWSVTVLAVVGYAWWVLARLRSLGRRVPANRQRWMMPDDLTDDGNEHTELSEQP
ncbi:MAG: hypothetical protein OXE93_05890 [bacterium]|nr:hypothetical protein [bacterium]MCY4257821.1 hypothetical protein [bacterium]